MSACGRRYFRIRCRDGFTPELEAIILEGYRRWRGWVDDVFKSWETHEYNAGEPRPDFRPGEPMLTEDGKEIVVAIEGEPRSYGDLKMFEDGVPWMFYEGIPRDVLSSLEVCYENPRLGLNEWSPLGKSGLG